MKFIPLGGHRRDSRIRGWALVDDEDYATLSGYKWRLHGQGYAVRHGKKGEKSVVYMHRQILGLQAGYEPQADHKNGVRHDNRRSNLRVVSHAQNQQNLRSRSPYRGVEKRDSGRYSAAVKMQGVRYRLGHFDTAEEANEALVNFRAEHLPYSYADQIAVGKC